LEAQPVTQIRWTVRDLDLFPDSADDTRHEIIGGELHVLDVYSRYGVSEYWIASWQDRSIQIFRRDHAQLQAAATLTLEDTLTSPLLPNFALPLRRLFAPPL
jgi:hypothetical protein